MPKSSCIDLRRDVASRQENNNFAELPLQLGSCLIDRAVPWKNPFMYRPLASDAATGRKRSPEAYGAILETTQTLLEEIGFEKLTIEGVASRAGVGKATIYRWWPSKGALAVEAFLTAVAPSTAFTIGESASRDLRAQCRRLARTYNGKMGKIVREIIGSGQFDSETMRLFDEGYLKPRRAAAKQVLQRGIAQGEFRRDIDLDAVVDALYAPIFHRLLLGHASNNEQFVKSLLDLVLGGISLKPIGSQLV
jgi:AcrR family transcriptional regulator